MRVVLVPAVAGALAPASLFAADYLSHDQVRAFLFPGARTEQKTLDVHAPWLEALQQKTGPFRGSLEVAYAGNACQGFLVVDEVIGKFERITFAVGMDARGVITQVEILAYRESHGHEVRMPAWRRQFKGRGASAALKVGQDIANISGATLSCAHVTEGVKRAVLLVDGARRSGLLP